MAAHPLDIYFERWEALDELITGLIDTYGQAAFPRKDTVLYLLKSLQAFARGHFQFFFFGFAVDHPAHNNGDLHLNNGDPHLEVLPEFPAEDILTGVLEQIGHDLELIRRAADQRISGSANVRQTLATADKLAWITVKPAIDYAAVEEATTVLTYFEKAAHFYRIPYAQVALIAIPLSCASTKNRRDYLAIPHEVGHYIYRHPVGEAQARLAKVRADLDDRLKDDLVGKKYRGYLQGIFEETFADIYGCLIGGPVMALDFQDLCLARSNSDFAGGDGEHANPAIRPLIYSAVLKNAVVRDRIKAISEDKWAWEPIANKLDAEWNAHLVRRDVHKFSFRISTRVDDTMIHVVDYVTPIVGAFDAQGAGGEVPILRYYVDGVVNAILENILVYGQQFRPKHNWLILQGWAGPTTADTRVDQLYGQYEENFDAILASVKVMPPEADPLAVDTAQGGAGAHRSKLWDDWVKHENEEAFKGVWPPAKLIEGGNVKEPSAKDKGKWGAILFAGGWTTGGPGTDPGHPQF